MATERKGYQNFLIFLATVFTLCFYAFYNGYPIIFFDTGTHIFSGFLRYVPGDRPIAYGLFIRYISLGEILWLIAIAQALFLTFLLQQLIKRLLPDLDAAIITFLISVFFTLFTGLSFHASQMLPDIFTSIALLSFFLLLIMAQGKLVVKILLSILLIFSMIVHNSHLVLLTLILVITSAFLWTKRYDSYAKNYFKNLPLCAVLILSSWLIIPSINYGFDKRFKISSGSHVFLMNRMVENGILDQYLKDNCGKKELKICRYKDSIPTNILWDYDHSPVYKMGGWDSCEKEFKEIIRETLVKPKYLKMHLHKSLEATLVQFFNFTTLEPPVIFHEHPGYAGVKIHFTQEVRQFDLSRQQGGRLNYSEMNKAQNLLFWASLIWCLLIVIYRPLRKKISFTIKLFLLIVFAGVLLNAFITGTLSGISERYQSRVVWMLILAAIVSFISIINKEKFKQRIRSLI